MNEFDLIQTYFKPRAGKRRDVMLGIGDDCALLQPPHGQLLAVSTDTLVENIHFLTTTSPHAIGHKSLAVSLSDLAAMGAQPSWVMLSLSLPEINETWISSFCDGFFSLLEAYDLELVGGNITRGPLSITTHITGFIPKEKALLRKGATPGDYIYVTGNLGAAALALRCLTHEINITEEKRKALQKRLDYPTPRIAAGLSLRNLATAAIDLSDGLAGDLEHLLNQSHVGALITVELLPLSEEMSVLPDIDAWELALSGGDDYELCFTSPPERERELKNAFTKINCPYHRIGIIEETPDLRLTYANGKAFHLKKDGYIHFQSE